MLINDKQAKNKQVPTITTLKLNASNVPPCAIRRFLVEHPTCQKVEVNDELHSDSNQHFKKTEHYDSSKPFHLENLSTGHIARFSNGNLFVDDCTLLAQDREVSFKRDNVKATDACSFTIGTDHCDFSTYQFIAAIVKC